MGEAIKKPTAFDVQVKNADRYVVYVALTQTLKCPTCKSGPLDTTDPVRFLKFSKLWTAFGLSEFEDINKDELITLLGITESTTITLDADVLRFSIDTLLSTSNNLNSFAPVIKLLNAIISIARDNKIKIDNYQDEETYETRQVSFTSEELKQTLAILFASKRCDAQFTLENGNTISHGAPIDHPKTIKEYDLYLKKI